MFQVPGPLLDEVTGLMDLVVPVEDSVHLDQEGGTTPLQEALDGSAHHAPLSSVLLPSTEEEGVDRHQDEAFPRRGEVDLR